LEERTPASGLATVAWRSGLSWGGGGGRRGLRETGKIGETGVGRGVLGAAAVEGRHEGELGTE